jgi:phosphoribosyl-ATP pyrophosphohydrolase
VQELIDAATPSHAAAELADVVFFALTAANVRGASLADTDKQLDLRTLRVLRPPHYSFLTCAATAAAC